jgi:hypothetical protein
VTVLDDGLKLRFTREGIEASGKKRGEIHRQAYAGLDKLIENAVYDGYENSDYDPE